MLITACKHVGSTIKKEHVKISNIAQTVGGKNKVSRMVVLVGLVFRKQFYAETVFVAGRKTRPELKRKDLM